MRAALSAAREADDRLQLVGELLARGLSIIPIEPRGKRPTVAWKAFQTAAAPFDQLERWFLAQPSCNFGIVTGAVSGVVAVDCDSSEAIAAADAHLPPTPMITKTARGEHRFYRHPGQPIANRARIRLGAARLPLDVRGDGGFVVGPGSVHETGVRYERAGEWPPIETLPVFDPTWLSDDVEDARGAGDQVLRGLPAVVGVRRPAGYDDDHVLRRARAYLDATPPAVEGQGGDTHTYQVCCRLVRGFDLSDGQALDLLRGWNARCVPPWSDDELAAKVAGARKYGDEPIGGRLGDATPRLAGRSPGSSSLSEYQSRPSVGRIRDEVSATANLPDRVTGKDGKSYPAGADRGAIPPESSGAATRAAGPPRRYNCTDAGNAEYFAARFGNDVRYDHRRGRYLLWRSHRWEPDPDAAIRRLAKATLRERFAESSKIEDQDERLRTAKWAIASESRPRLEALLFLAQAEAPIADAGESWDTDAMLVGASNGVIDLRRGTLRDGRRDDRITMSVTVPFNPAARCPRWERFLSEVFADDGDMVSFVARAVGYSLSGDTSEQCLFLCHGAGANGKGTFSRVLMAVFGDYAANMPFSTIELHQRSTIPNDLAALVGRRLVVASETNDGTRLNEARVKALTGCDPITARFLHSEFFTFEPVAKFWLSVNHRPVVRDDSYGFWRRIRLIPFTQTFTLNPTLFDELMAEAEGILAWAVRGCQEWQQHGLNPPAVVLQATAAYEQESDPLGDFLNEACEADPEAEVPASAMFEHYRAWADRRGLTERERLGAMSFGRKLSERLRRSHTRTGWVYFGVSRRAL
jgi:P4 family phage/plasmid primase-like protien